MAATSTNYVFPRSVGVVHWNGGLVRLNAGQVWAADDPFVKARPELFSVSPEFLSTTRDPRGQIGRREVEAATKAPGEKRGAVRG